VRSFALAVRPLLAAAAGHAFRILPRRARYAVAHRIALLIAPILRRSSYYARRPSRLDGYREESLRIMLRLLARSRVRFDPDIEMRGRELFPDEPTLIVSGHFLLNVHMTRWMFDAGRDMTAVLGGEREPMYYSGTLRDLGRIIVGPLVLQQMRSHLLKGSDVFIDIESGRMNEGWTPVETAAGTRWTSIKPLQFAKRIGVPVIFASTIIDERGRMVVTYVRPSSDDPEVMLREFGEFLRVEAARVAR
jgi:hypothetical protein